MPGYPCAAAGLSICVPRLTLNRTAVLSTPQYTCSKTHGRYAYPQTVRYCSWCVSVFLQFMLLTSPTILTLPHYPTQTLYPYEICPGGTVGAIDVSYGTEYLPGSVMSGDLFFCVRRELTMSPYSPPYITLLYLVYKIAQTNRFFSISWPAFWLAQILQHSRRSPLCEKCNLVEVGYSLC